VAVVALLLMLWAMIEPALQAYDYGDRKLELGIKVWIVWAAAFAGTIGAIISAVFVAWVGERRA
jgi:membrane associated rhomboid family serine protease